MCSCLVEPVFFHSLLTFCEKFVLFPQQNQHSRKGIKNDQRPYGSHITKNTREGKMGGDSFIATQDLALGRRGLDLPVKAPDLSCFSSLFSSISLFLPSLLSIRPVSIFLTGSSYHPAWSPASPLPGDSPIFFYILRCPP